MTIFLAENLRPATADLKLLQASAVEIATISGLTATDVQSALAALAARGSSSGGGSGTGLTDRQSNTLADINNAVAFEDAYFTIPNGKIAAASSAATPAPVLPFTTAPTGFTIASTTAAYFVELPSRFDLRGVALVEYNSSSVQQRVHSISAATASGAALNNVQRYSVAALTGAVVGNTLRLQWKNPLYNIRTTAANTTVIPQNGIGASNAQEALEELQAEITAIDVPTIPGADGITYSATAPASGTALSATDVEAALDELNGDIQGLNIPTIPPTPEADDIAYSATAPASGSALTATNVEAALDELNGDIQGLNIPTIPGADGITYSATAPASGTALSATNVEAALDELNGDIQGLNIPANAGELTSTAGNGLVATDVQSALDELQAEIIANSSAGTGLTGTQSRKLAEIAETGTSPNFKYALSDDYSIPSTGVTRTATTNLAGTTVEAALTELQAEIDGLPTSSGTSLSSEQTRVLDELTASNLASSVYTEITGAEIGSTTINSGTFAASLTGATGAHTVILRLPRATPSTPAPSLAGILIQRVNASGVVIDEVDMATVTTNTSPNQTHFWFTAPEAITVASTDVLRARRRGTSVYGVQTDAASSRVSTIPNLTATNVQAALAELQGDITNVTGLTGTQSRKLADITEVATTTYADVANVRTGLASGNPLAPSFGLDTPPSSITGSSGSPFVFEVPTGTSLANTFLVVRNDDTAPTTGTGVVTEVDVSGLTKITGASTGADRYGVAALTYPAGTAILRVQVRTTVSDTFTLSSKYRAPSTSITRTATTNLAGTTVEAALTELQAEVDSAGVTDLQKRKLADITEATSNTYQNIALAQIADGSSDIPGNFGQQVAGSQLSVRWFVEIPVNTPVANVFLVRRNGNVVDAEFPLASEPTVTGANPGRVRYRTRENIAVALNQTLRIQTRTVNYDTYSLSSKYRLPAAGVVGELIESQLSSTLQERLLELENVNYNTFTEYFFRQALTQGTAFSTPDEALTEARWSAEYSSTLSDYTNVSGGGATVPIVTGADTYVAIRDTRLLRSARTNGANRVAVVFEHLGNPLANHRVYRLRTSALAAGTTVELRGGVPTISIRFLSTLKMALNNLTDEVTERLVTPKIEDVFDHVELSGQLTDPVITTEFYYLPATSLTTAKRTLSDWTHVTNAHFPQIASTTPARYVVLLPKGRYPDSITWDPDPTQPTPSASSPNTTSVSRQGFQGIAATLVPEGFAGFSFVMPAWNAASAARIRAVIRVGTLAEENVDRIDFDETVKITDNNLELSSPTSILTAAQQEKLDNLQLKTFTQPRLTTGKPNEHYDLLLASAWPDPVIDYVTPGRILTGQDPSVTGVRETGTTLANASVEFFNLISQANVTLDTPQPAASAATWLGQIEVAHDYAGCAGLLGGSIQAKDNNTTPRLRIDDEQGVFAAMTLHINHRLPVGSYEVMNIGNPTANSANGLVLRKASNGALSLLAREFTGNPTSTTRQQDVRQQLGASNGAVSQLFRIPPGHTGSSLNDVKGWVIPDALTASSTSPIRLQWFIRVWNNDNDEGVHDFTSSMPAQFRSLSSKSEILEQTFTINFQSAGFTEGPANVSCSMRLRAASSGNLPEIFFRMTLTNAAIAYEVTAFAVTTQTVTVPAGSTRDFPLEGMDYLNRSVNRFGTVSYDTGDRDVELGFYVFSQAQASSTGARTLRYQASANGDVSDVRDSSEAPPTGAAPVTFGINGNNNFAVNRFAIFRPKNAGFDRNSMRDLTTKSLRNRPIVGGLIRQAGGTFHEVFSPAYKAVTYSVSALTNLPSATTVYPNWSADTDEPPELSHVSGTSTFTATTNFVGLVTVSANVEVEFTSTVATLASRSMILVDGTLQEQLPGSSSWNDVAGPRLYEEILQGNLRPPNRPEITGGNTHPQVRRGYNTTVQFKRGATYRFDITGYRLTSGGAIWPTTSNLVRLPAEQTFLQIAILPTV